MFLWCQVSRNVKISSIQLTAGLDKLNVCLWSITFQRAIPWKLDEKALTFPPGSKKNGQF